jgi:hypothetical protein
MPSSGANQGEKESKRQKEKVPSTQSREPSGGGPASAEQGRGQAKPKQDKGQQKPERGKKKDQESSPPPGAQ